MASLMNDLDGDVPEGGVSPREGVSAAVSFEHPDDNDGGKMREDPTHKKPEDVNEIRPDYYGKEDPYEPWKIIRAKKMDFFQGNALKYLMRAGVKNPETLDEDIDKAITYLLEWKRNGNSHE